MKKKYRISLLEEDNMIENFEQKFLEFCKSKHPEERYRAGAPKHCALGQFVEELGYNGRSDGYSDFFYGEYRKYPDRLFYLAVGGDIMSDRIHPHNTDKDFFTFGKLVERLENE